MLYSTRTLQYRLVVQVTLGLLIFSVLAGIITYQYSYKKQLEVSLRFQNQLVRTIQSQAEIAIFATNEEIGHDILNGLLTNPLLEGVRLESNELFKLEQITESESTLDKKPDVDFSKGMSYPLFSPVSEKEQIGSLTVVRNNRHIRSEAAKASTTLTLLMLSQLLMAALLMMWVSRRVIGKPVADLAKKVVSVKPGENSRINVSLMHAYDEIGMLSGSINELIDAAENALYESAAARKSAESANRAKSEFLDNSGEGFLSFGADMVIDPEYSHECEAIFEHGLCYLKAGSNISDLLFGESPSDKKEFFNKTLDFIFTEPLDLKRELYISLLQPVYIVGQKYIKAKYKMIADDTKMMLILTDITREKELEQHVASERKRLKFVIAAVRETRDFFAILDEVNQFKQTYLPQTVTKLKSTSDSDRYRTSSRINKSLEINILKEQTDSNGNFDHKEILYEIYRQVHTFKGLFAQQEFLSFPEFLHEMETRISGIIGKISDRLSLFREMEKFTEDFQNESVLEQDLLIIRSFLGDEFIERKGDVVISSELASKIESMATSLIEMMGNKIDKETLEILQQVKLLRYVDIKSLLHPYAEGALRLADRLGKYLNPFEPQGDDVEVHPDRLTPFIRSLVNVFRNAVDHGIEEPEERLEAEKDEYATIGCNVRKSKGYPYGNVSVECIEIAISDDGRGIDLMEIRNRVAAKNLIEIGKLETMPANEMLQMIFLDDLSTRDITDAMSGRGMGLSAVKRELERLNGKVEIETQAGRGTCFYFYIPI